MFNSRVIRTKLQRQNTMINGTGARQFLLQSVSPLKRKSSSSSDDAFLDDSNSKWSAFTLCRPTKRRRRTSSSSSSTCSSEGDDSQVLLWLQGVKNIISDTIHECKVGVSKVYPWPLNFSMQCKALVQTPDPVTGNFSLLVLCQRLSSSPDLSTDDLCGREDYTWVGGSVKPKTIKTGRNYFFSFLLSPTLMVRYRYK